MSDLRPLLDANARYADRFDHGDLSAPPRHRLAILTCMDARIDPLALLGLEPGDAHVVRNAGGRATDDAIRSLVVSSHLLGTREFLVIHHTGCGMMGASNVEIAARVTAHSGADASAIDFLPFADLDQSVRDDVETIRRSPYMPRDVAVHGLVYDVRTGRLRVVGD